MRVSGNVFDRLFSIDEDGFRTRRMTYFCNIFERYLHAQGEL